MEGHGGAGYDVGNRVHADCGFFFDQGKGADLVNQELDPDRLRALMRERGVSRQSLADRIPISADQVSRWCTGRSGASRSSIERIADALGVLPEDLYQPSPMEEELVSVFRRLQPKGQGQLVRLARTIFRQQEDGDDGMANAVSEVDLLKRVVDHLQAALGDVVERAAEAQRGDRKKNGV